MNRYFKTSLLPQRMLCMMMLFLAALSPEGCKGGCAACPTRILLYLYNMIHGLQIAWHKNSGEMDISVTP